MTKIIQLYSTDKEYQHQIDEICTKLASFEEEVYMAMINIATKGVWKDWDETLQDGSSFIFEPEAFQNTGDKNISELWDFRQKIIELQNKLT